jgi:cobalt-zinc-cadmium efflux system outer membrane protein
MRRLNLAWAMALSACWPVGAIHAAESADSGALGQAIAHWRQSAPGSPWTDPNGVQQTMEARPAWQRARQEREAASALSEGTLAGNAEWSVDLLGAVRRSDDPTRRQTREWELGMQRPWRSGHKSRLAGEQADAQRAMADVMLARQWQELQWSLVDDLADAWAQQSAAAGWLRAEQAMRDQVAAMRKRTALGEASELDARQSEAALAQVQSQARQAQWRLTASVQQWQQRWPQWPWHGDAHTGPWAPQWSGCELGALSRDAWAEAAVRASPEVRWAQAQWQQARLQANVDAAQRTPDPSFGIKGGQAASGAERHLGVTFSMAIGGEARDAQSRASAHQMLAAQHAVDDTLLAARRQALATWNEWQGACGQWQMEQQALDAQTWVAQAMQRAHALGEGSLQSFLQAQATTQELSQRAESARIQTWRAFTRVLVMSGELWPSSSLQAAARPSGP